jgi:acyl carrier protein
LDIRSDIRGFILDNFMMGRDPQELTDSGSLLELGIIDSTGVLELVGFMEEKFALQVEDEELVPENLDSIDNLFGYIQRKTALKTT